MGWLDRAASDTQVTHGQRLWLYALAALVLAFLVVPTLIVIPRSAHGASSIARRRRSPISAAPSGSVLGRMIANSSPP